MSFKYFETKFILTLKTPCLPTELSEFLFNWSIETVRQLGKALFNQIPNKIFITKPEDLKEFTRDLNQVEKLIKLFDVSDFKKVDKFEFICLLPFIVDSNFEVSLLCKVTNE